MGKLPKLTLPPPVTARQVANSLVDFADQPVTIERLKHWSRKQLLKPFDDRHPGTGRHRHYSIGEVIDAAVLSELTAAGLSVASLDYVPQALKLARKAFGVWRGARSRGEPDSSFLLIERRRGNPEVVRVTNTVKTDATLESVLIINLAQMFTRIGGLSQ
jgi:hypothetical protein